jgi:hypothetical protein
MAENLTPEEQKELNSLLKERERLEKQITINVEKASNARHMEKKRLDELIKKGDEELEIMEKKIKSLQKIKEAGDYQVSIGKALTVKDEKVLKLIEGRITKNSLLSVVTGKLIELKQNEINLEGDALKASEQKREVFESLAKGVVDQAKHMAHHGEELNAFDKERKELLEKIKDFSAEEREEALKLLQIKQNLVKKEQRFHALQHQVSHLAHHLPEGITSAAKGMVGLVKGIGKAGMAMAPLVLLVAALGAGLHAFMEMDKAGEEFRKEIGLTVNQSKQLYDIAHHTAVEYRDMGVTAKDAFDTIKALKDEQSDMLNATQNTVDAISLMNVRLGITAKDSAGVVSIFQQMGGLSESAATSAALQAANMATKVGVSTKAVFADMNKSAAMLSKHMRGNVELFVQQAIKARMLGTSLEGLTKTAENLLDFENSIEEELVAATYVGGQFNLTRARALAYEGKIAEANEEILNQIQASGDFRKQDYFTQTQLAKAAGKSVEDITKELDVRDKLKSLNGKQLKNAEALIAKGIDIRDLSDDEVKKQAEQLANQERIAGVMSEIQNKIAGIVEQVGGRLTPIFDVLGGVLIGILGVFANIGDVIKYMQENTWAMVTGSIVLGTLAAAMIGMKISQLMLEKKIKQEKLKQLSPELATASASIFGGFGKLGPLGIGLAIAAVAGMVVGAYALLRKGDDVVSPGSGGGGYGDRTLFGPEGAIQLNNRDTVIAGTDLFKKDGQTQTATPSISPISSTNNHMINTLINEFRGVRADMATGKIGVYMDNERVTANIGKTLDTSTRNKFALA